MYLQLSFIVNPERHYAEIVQNLDPGALLYIV